MAERGIQIEPFSGGLNNALDPALLKEGELTQCDNAFYKPNSMSIHKAPSRTVLATSIGGSSVSGLRYCAFDFVNVPCMLTSGNATITPKTGYDFDGISAGASVRGTGVPNNTTVQTYAPTQIIMSKAATLTDNQSLQFQADNVIIAQANSEYKTANATTGSLTFSTLTTVSEGPTLEAIHYANKHVLINGVNDNKVLLSDKRVRAHGLEAMHTGPICTTAAGTWALLSGTGYYAYWTTEYDAVNQVESTFDGKPTPINVSTTSLKVIINQPQPVNSTATQWRVYRSTKMAATSDEAANLESVALSSGLLIGTAELKTDGTQNTIEDGGGATSIGPFYPTTLGVTAAAWANPSNALNNTTADSATCTLTGLFEYHVLEVATFNVTTSSINPPVSGITVFLRAKRTGSATAKLAIAVWDSQSFPPPTGTMFGATEPWKGCKKSVVLTTSAADYTIGSSSDLWGATTDIYTWTPGSFANGRFSIVLLASGGPLDTIDVYNIGVSVSYGKAQQLGTQTQFPAVTIKPFGETVVVGRNGRPPKASIGDIFQGSLVLNDVEDESMIRYSYPDNIDAFPSIYFLNFETADQDRVSLIKTVGNNLVVSLRSRLFRVSYLPRDVDAEFDRGRAIEEIDSTIGVVGPSAGIVFTMADGTPLLFGVSNLGPFVTDGYRVRPATQALNWEKLVDRTHMDNVIVINNPQYSEILVYYVPLGSGTPTVLTKYLRFNYHPSHLKEDGTMKVIGPCDCDVRSAALAVLRDSTRVLYTGMGTVATVNLENQGAVNSMTIRSRQLYLAGAGNEWKLQEHYLKHTLYDFAAASPMNINTTVHIDRTGLARRDSMTRAIPIVAYPSDGSAYPQDSRLDKTTYGEMCEGAIFEFAPGNATHKFALDYHVITGFGFGRENAQ